ncbi:MULTISPECIES: hypothetical protein [unclassified Gordonia (in: high G+C Gram-positive bacteria)]|uniref:hypothetical protein n=1 Tax=unclassified Gordonia (in: high G+C Gram-positive bacteria) TaxID=2657482 RepID=UPI001FFEBBB2|nr:MULTISPECIES: hypothetical protein [unclassified Gordonia (in: high G+C Gram-positive bacteria)]UQE74579.1 hypothetical protein MYK68_17970 [Gordonia sp. PP30]
MFGIDFAAIGQAIAQVLAVGLVLGAGLPALFAVGMRCVAAGEGGEDATGALTAPNPALKYLGYLLYIIVAAVILLGILWITRQTIYHHFDVKIFPAGAYK